MIIIVIIALSYIFIVIDIIIIICYCYYYFLLLLSLSWILLSIWFLLLPARRRFCTSFICFININNCTLMLHVLVLFHYFHVSSAYIISWICFLYPLLSYCLSLSLSLSLSISPLPYTLTHTHTQHTHSHTHTHTTHSLTHTHTHRFPKSTPLSRRSAPRIQRINTKTKTKATK